MVNRTRQSATKPISEMDSYWQSALAMAFERLGTLAWTQGNLPDAQRQFGESLRIRQQLADSDPTDAMRQSELSISFKKLGGLHRAASEFESAIEQFLRGSAVLERMIQNGQNVTASQRELSSIQQQIQSCAVALIAIGDWDDLMQQPVDRLPFFLQGRCRLMARQKRTADVAKAAAKLQEIASAMSNGNTADDIGSIWMAAACGYGLCAKLTCGWDGAGEYPPDSALELGDEQKAARDKYIADAIACLKEALAAGWTDFEHMRQDPDLAALHGLPEFEALFPKEEKKE